MVGLFEFTNWPKTGRRPKTSTQKRKLNIHVISDGITRLPILEGEISQIELPRCDTKVLGMTIVGGSDTPLRCIVIQEVFNNGFIEQDRRLQPGDQIVEVDGRDMTNATHKEVFAALKKTCDVLRLGIYREKIEYCSVSASSSLIIGHDFDRRYFGNQTNSSSVMQIYIPIKKQFQLIKLRKNANQRTGIILRRNMSNNELLINEITAHSAADNDTGLDLNDCLISINGEDVRNYELSVINDLLEKLEQEVYLVVKKFHCTNSNPPVNHILNTINDSDGKTWSSSSMSDPISELSCVDDQANLSDNISEHSRSSFETKSVSDIGSIADTGIYCYEKGYEDESYQFNIHSSSNDFGKRQSTISESHSVIQSSSVDNMTNIFSHRKFSQTTNEQKIVILHKKEGEGLGMRIGGGLNSNDGDTPIYVANINENGPAGRSRKIKKGDIVLSVNEHLILGLTHSQAVAYLKLTSNLTSVSLTIFEGTETSKGINNFIPSWLFWQKLPKPLHISKCIVLNRIPGASLGFSIVGGNDSQRGPEPIHVLFVVASSPAAKEGKLRSGDKLLAVDGHSLESVPHAVAVSMLKHAGNRVLLEIVSWLGTEI